MNETIKPDIFLQWKGTDVCLDFNCVCGHHSHIDDYFCYYIRCPNCNRVYELSPQIDSRELSQEEIGKLTMTPKCEGEFTDLRNLLEEIADAGGEVVDYHVDYGDDPNVEAVKVEVVKTAFQQKVVEEVKKSLDNIIGKPNDDAIIGKITKIFDTELTEPITVLRKSNKNFN